MYHYYIYINIPSHVLQIVTDEVLKCKGIKVKGSRKCYIVNEGCTNPRC